MKDKTMIVKVDDQFIEKVDYLQRINDYKNRSDCVRKVVEKEWRKERTALCDECEMFNSYYLTCEDGYVSHDGFHECLAFRGKKEKADGHTN